MQRRQCIIAWCVLMACLMSACQDKVTEVGVTATEIRMGQVCALTGPAQSLGKEMQEGATAYFAYINSQGGIHGRTLKLITLDDGYEPDKTLEATKKLLDQEKVFMLFGYVGTPTSLAVLPLVQARQVPFFGPFTGAESLRTPLLPNVYHVRASYFQETEAQVRELVDKLGKTKIAVFYQHDSFGQAGLEGAQQALRKRNLSVSATGTYERNTVDVQAAVDAITQAAPEAVVMVGAYKPSAAFIKATKAAGLKALFLNVSFVGSIPLAQELGSDGDGVIVTQVVPLPWDSPLPLVAEYRSHMGLFMPRAPLGLGSLEGYVDAMILGRALQQTGRQLTRAALMKTLDSLSAANFGGLFISFKPDNHQGSNTVYFSVIKEGRYKSILSLKALDL